MQATGATNEYGSSINLSSFQEINKQMRYKNRFIVSSIKSQHFYLMKNKIKEQKNNQILQYKKSFDQLPEKQRSLSQLKPQKYLQLQNNSSEINNNSIYESQDIFQIQPQLLLESNTNRRQSSIEEMLQQAGYDISTQNQKIKVANEFSHALKKRTFFNCNRGMGLFQPKLPSISQNEETYRTRNTQNDQMPQANQNQPIKTIDSFEQLKTTNQFKASEERYPSPFFQSNTPKIAPTKYLTSLNNQILPFSNSSSTSHLLNKQFNSTHSIPKIYENSIKKLQEKLPDKLQQEKDIETVLQNEHPQNQKAGWTQKRQYQNDLNKLNLPKIAIANGSENKTPSNHIH